MEIEPDRPFVRTMRSLILEIPPLWSQPSLKPDEHPSDKELENSAAAEPELHLSRNRQTYIGRQQEKEIGD